MGTDPIDVGLDVLASTSEVMATLIARHGAYTPRRAERPEPFKALAKAIIYQQLAGKAASAIHARFETILNAQVTPEAVLSLGPEGLRGAGLSGAKSAAICALARHAEAGELSLRRLDGLEDEALSRSLCRVRGIGPWTAQMFMIFELGRLDVWPTGDLGVRKGYHRAFQSPELPSARTLEPLGAPFRPYRSIVAWYCWRAADTPPPKP